MRNVIARPSVLGAGVVLMLTAGSVSAAGLSNVLTNNINIAYWSLNQVNCTLTKSTLDPGQTARTAIVQGSNTPCVPGSQPGPGGNIELGDVDSTVWATPSTMSGTLPLGPLTLSSLTLADWNSQVAPGVSLAEQYISEAVLANCGVPIPPPLLGPSVACFLSGLIADCTFPPLPPPTANIVPPPAERASDPNVSYVNSDGNLVTIGLAGAENAVDLLPPTFACPNTGTKPDPLRLSEVVKFEADWATTSPQYLYSFNAAPSGTVTNDPTQSYDATYEVRPAVPTPTPPLPSPVPAIQPFGLVLLSFGLMIAAGWARRRRR